MDAIKRPTLKLLLWAWLWPLVLNGAAVTNVPARLSPWGHSLSTQVAAGYNNNLLLSRAFRESSPLLFGGLEATVWRIPGDGSELFFFLKGEYTRYLPDRTLEDEQLAYLVALGRRKLSELYRLGLQVQAVYQSTVVDASATEFQLVPLPVKGYTLSTTPELRRELGRHWSLTLEGTARRQWFDGQLDDYWEGGPRLIAGRQYSRRSNAQLAYRYAFRDYDTRLAPDERGFPIAGRGLTYQLHEVALANTHHFDDRRRWRLNSKLGAGLNLDNGSGYWDFVRYEIAERVRFAPPGFTIEGHARALYFDYQNQTSTGLPGAPGRYLASVQVGVRIEKRLGPHFNAFAEYTHDWQLSNRSINEYDADRVRGGIEWQF
jgi:hypothetical protein